jgi:hypothetical protein
MIGSLVVAVLIVIVTIAIVTAKLGPAAELRENEEGNEDSDNSGSGKRIDGGPVRWRLATDEMVVFPVRLTASSPSRKALSALGPSHSRSLNGPHPPSIICKDEVVFSEW